MRYANYILIGLLSLMLTACAAFPGPAPVGDSPPVIRDYWASPTVQGGDQWRVYVKVDDPDGDLWEAQFWAWQAGSGYGRYDGYFFLPKQYREGIDGYFYFDIPYAYLFDSDPVVYMRFADRGGRTSQTVALPLHVTARGRYSGQKAPDGFADNRIYKVPIYFRTHLEDPNQGAKAPLFRK